MRARFYIPEIRRFVNRDILLGNVGSGQSLNRFAFVTGRTVSFVDPFGLIKLKEPSLPKTGETTIHANPGPEATPPRSRADHEHVHLGDNDSSHVGTDDFKPLAEKDAKKMTKKQ